MYIYFNYLKQQSTVVPHGQIVRQGDSFDIFLAMDPNWVIENGIESITYNYKRPSDTTVNPGFSEVSSSHFYQEKFRKLNDSEVTFGLKENKSYTIAHFVIQQVGDTCITSEKGDLQITFIFNSNRTDSLSSTVKIFVEPSLNVKGGGAVSGWFIPLNGSNKITGSLIPNEDEGASLGSLSKKWEFIYAKQLQAWSRGESSGSSATLSPTGLELNSTNLSPYFSTSTIYGKNGINYQTRLNNYELFFPNASGTLATEEYVNNKTELFSSITKISKYLYEIDYNILDYEFGKKWIEEQYKPQLSGCSSVRNGNYFGRNLDWYYNESVDFVVRTSRNANRFASIGISSSVPTLTAEYVEEGHYGDSIYKAIPFRLVDGINEKGVFVNTNVVPLEPNQTTTTGTIPLIEEKDSICAAMLVRYILDNFDSALGAINYIRNYVSIYANKKMLDLGMETHFLIGDNDSTYVLEFINNEIVYFEQNKMTNFYLNDVIFNADGSVYTPETQDSTHDAVITNHVQLRGQGLERYNLINSSYDNLSSKQNMINFMKTQLDYRRAYDTFSYVSNPYWYTEFTGDYDGTSLFVNTPSENYATAKQLAGDAFSNRDRSQDENGTWHTMHTSVYDLVNLSISVFDSTEDGIEHEFSLVKTYSKIEIDEKIVTLSDALNEKQDKLSTTQLSAVNSGITPEKVSAYDSHISNTNNPHDVTKAQIGLGNVDNTSDINKPISNATQDALDDITDLIPNQATTSNQLADKAFVNSSIATNTAIFRGTYNSVQELPTSGITNNDYAFVIATDQQGNTLYNRYKYVVGTGWLFEYSLNNSSFTSNQWASINSGITSGDVEDIADNTTARHTHSNKTELDLISSGDVSKWNNKQDTLIAGTNISISNNVISSTAQDNSFRGSWSNWATVPSDSTLYPEDMHGLTTPLNGDYIVVQDSSDWSPKIEDWNTYLTTTGESGNNIIVFWDKDGNKLASVSSSGQEITICDGKFTVYFAWNGDERAPQGSGTYILANTTPIKFNDVIYPIGSRVFIGYTDGAINKTIYFSDQSFEHLSGTWRFHYNGIWESDGKNGWIPEYNVKEVLPVADDTQAGITKLYDSLGNNIDGAVDQNMITTALNTKQNKLTAGTNITIDDNNVISSSAVESFFRGRFDNWQSTPTNASQYETDYHGSKTPTENDYIILTDARDYTTSTFDGSVSAYMDDTVLVASVNNGQEIRYSATPERDYYIDDIAGNHIFKVHCQPRSQNAMHAFYAEQVISFNDTLYMPGDLVHNFNRHEDEIQTFQFRYGYGTLQGTWKFTFHGNWTTDGKEGWKPEYQLENTLPIASDTQLGITKLYQTTGNNTDGALSQQGVTDAINTHNNNAYAHNNIRGRANGIATLDGNGKVPLEQMNDAVLGNVSYQGTWNAATNTPYLPNPAGDLPAGYTQFNYMIHNFVGSAVGTSAHIDTGIYFDDDTEEMEYEIKFMNTSTNYQVLFGACDTITTNNVETNSSGSVSHIASLDGGFISAGNSHTTESYIRKEEHTIILTVNKTTNRYSYTLDGISHADLSFEGTPNSTNSIYLGWTHATTVSAMKGFRGKIYYFRVKKDGVLVGDFKPAQRTLDGVFGYYDLVTDTFFTVQGIGTLTGEGQITLPQGHYYITNTAGTQFGLHFEVGDWIIATNNEWKRVANTDAVASVQGRTGNVVIIDDDVTNTDYGWSGSKIASGLATKQDKLTAGPNITIYNDGTISAVDTKYVAGNGLTLTGQSFSANVIDNTTSTSTTDALSANMGKELQGQIDSVESKIPSQATSSNQLADKAFVNSSITTNTATFRGTSASGLSEQQFLTWANGLTKTNNDYVFWNTVDANGNVVFKRYKYNGSTWVFEYDLNNSSFTSNQWASINSGITSGDVEDIADNTTARHTHSNKSILDTLTDTQTELDGKIDAKQNTLVSGTNIKTINGQSVLGSGDITIQSGGNVDDVTVDGVSVVSNKIAVFETATDADIDAMF